MLTKEEYKTLVNKIHYSLSYHEADEEVFDCLEKLEELIEEHFYNPPLKFEELKEGMIVWDDYNKEFVRIDYLTMFNTWTYYNFNYVFPIELEFDENRFYRKQVLNEERD